jgi:hypothetical protein
MSRASPYNLYVQSSLYPEAPDHIIFGQVSEDDVAVTLVETS